MELDWNVLEAIMWTEDYLIKAGNYAMEQAVGVVFKKLLGMPTSNINST